MTLQTVNLRRHGDAASSASFSRPVPTIPGYTIQSELGQGGMGVVYMAEQHSLQRLVAIKMTSGRMLEGECQILRLLNEAQALGRLKHSNIVQVYDIGFDASQSDSAIYFVMEYIEGSTLGAHVGASPRPEQESAALVETLARAIHYAHENGVVHRDLKPGNILMTPAGQPKIVDFGLVKLIDPNSSGASGAAAHGAGHTQTGMIMGTAEYMAPEQATGKIKELGPAVDVYSLGVILYELLTGRRPFEGITNLDVLDQVRQQEPVSPRLLQPRLSRDIETICLKCLEKQPQKRYATALALAEDLQRLQDGKPILARPVSGPERLIRTIGRYPVVSGLILAVILTLALGAGLATWFAVQANDSARQARENAQEANDNEKVANSKAEEARLAALLAERKTEEAGASEARARANALRALAEKNKAEAARLTAEDLTYGYQVLLSFREWDKGDVFRAREVLDATRWDRRGWEHRYLQNLYDREPVLEGHLSSLYSVAFSPDQQLLASGDEDGTVKVWEFWSRQELYTLNAHGLYVDALAFSPDSSTLASAGVGKEILLWDTATGRKLAVIRSQHSRIFALAFSPDGTKIVSGSEEGKVDLWEVATGKLLKTFDGQMQALRTVAFSPNNKNIAAFDRAGRIRLWNLDSGDEEKLAVPKVTGPLALGFSKDSELLIWAKMSLGLELFNPRTKRSLRRIAWDQDRAKPIRIVADPGMKHLAVADDRGTLQLWNPTSIEPVRTLSSQGCATLRFDAAGRWLCGAGEDHKLKLWNVAEKRYYRVMPIEKRRLHATATFHPRTSRAVALPDRTNDLLVWDVQTEQEQGTLTGHTGAIKSRAISNDGTWLASGSLDRTVKVWDLETCKEVKTLIGHDAPVQRVLFGSQRRFVASVDSNNVLLVWDTEKDKPLASLAVRNSVCVEADPAQPRLAYVPSCPPGTKPVLRFHTWDNDTEKTREWPLERRPDSLHFSPDGRWLFLTLGNQQIHLLDTASGTTRTFKGGQGINQPAISPDGKYLGCILGRSRLGVWDLETGGDFLEIGVHLKEFQSWTFSPDGSQLVSVAEDGQVQVWGLARRQLTLALQTPITKHARRSIFFAGDGRYLCCRENLTLVIWDAGEGFTVHRSPSVGIPSMSVALHPNGKQFATMRQGGRFQVWDATTGTTAFEGSGSTGWGQEIACSSDGRFWAVARHKVVDLYDSSTGERVRSLDGSDSPIQAVAFHPTANRLATGNRDGNVLLWDVETGLVLDRIPGEKAVVRKLVFSSDGQRLAASYSLGGGLIISTYQDRFAVVWDLATRKSQARVGWNGLSIYDLDLNTNGSKLALAVDGKVILWDVDRGMEWKSFAPHGGKVLAVDFSPDEARLLTSGGDGSVRIWDVPTLEERFLFKGHQHDVNGASFSADGEWVLTRSLDQTSYLFQPTGRRQSFYLPGGDLRQERVRR